MSERPDGPRREPALPDDDDWFATPGPQGSDWFSPQGPPAPPGEPDEPLWYEDVDEPPPPAGPPGLGQRQVTVVVAVVAIVAVIALGILAVRWIGGSDSTETPPATTTAVTTGPATTQATTTQETTTTSTTTTTTPATTVSEVPAGQTLRQGMSGSSVLALQQALIQLGYDPGGADGKYGDGTTQAVKEFQAAQGLTQDGTAGPATLAAINEQLAKG